MYSGYGRTTSNRHFSCLRDDFSYFLNGFSYVKLPQHQSLRWMLSDARA
jgi:hypothetical protein